MIVNALRAKYWIFLLLLIGLHACADKDSDKLFRQLTPRKTGINFANNLTETEDFNIIEYLYFYNGGGVAVGDINNDNLPDILFTANQLPNKLYLNKGDLEFEDITEKAGITSDTKWKTGVTMADVNGDGWLDIYVCHVGKYKILESRNELYINNQDGTFSEKAAAYGLDFQGFSTQAAFFDYDRDGDLDMYLLNHAVHAPDVYGEANLRNVRDSLSGDRLYRNDGETFTNVTAQSGIYSSRLGYGLGVAVGDFNNDGWADLYISNDFRENDYIYYNNGDGSFSDGTTVSLGHTSAFSMGSDVADFNNDGRLDLMTLDMKPEEETVLKSSVGADPYNIYRYKLQYGYYYQYPRNMLQLNRGALEKRDQFSKPVTSAVQFSEIAQFSGVDATDWSWSSLFCDLDNDGWKDIFITNGIWRRPNDLDYLKFISTSAAQRNASNLELANKMPSGSVPNYAYRNKGDLTFEKVSAQWGLDLVGCSNGAAYADLDNDGDLDLVTNNLNAPATVFENRANEKLQRNYLKIRLQDEQSKNRFGIGARVYVQAGEYEQVQELYPSRGFQSASEPLLNFGLDSIIKVDLTVRWADGQMQYLKNVKANQTLTIKKNAAAPDTTALPAYLLTNITAQTGINFQHQENNYVDFDREKLMPHMLSTQGPKLAVGDVNGDGLEDFYICGANGQAGKLYLQQKNNQFKVVQTPDFEKYTNYEDVDATFFDADKDGDMDLYVVSGGGEIGQAAAFYQDRLYVNNGKGIFTKKLDALPEILANGGCVVAADFNEDGATDLFVGSRSAIGGYGLSPDSYILLNDGKANFTLLESPILQKFGMVTDAVWLAKEKTLVVVGEWMPVTKMEIKKLGNSKSPRAIPTFQYSIVPNSNGWWNTIHAADLDGDGDEDLLLGNAGLNSTLKASIKEPVELYVADFDSNWFTDPIMTYFKQGKRYTYYAKDELFSQLISIKKKFVDYAPFAKSTFEEVFDAEQLAKAEHKFAYTFASAFAENQGNGQFVLHNLPSEAQFAPIFAYATGDFNQDNNMDIIAVGNWYDVQPSMGRYDASYGVLLQGDGKGNFNYIEPGSSGFIVNGEGRDLKILSNREILVARNNLPMLVFRGSR